jgi:hypothetical protein
MKTELYVVFLGIAILISGLCVGLFILHAETLERLGRIESTCRCPLPDSEDQ